VAGVYEEAVISRWLYTRKDDGGEARIRGELDLIVTKYCASRESGICPIKQRSVIRGEGMLAGADKVERSVDWQW